MTANLTLQRTIPKITLVVSLVSAKPRPSLNNKVVVRTAQLFASSNSVTQPVKPTMPY